MLVLIDAAITATVFVLFVAALSLVAIVAHWRRL